MAPHQGEALARIIGTGGRAAVVLSALAPLIFGPMVVYPLQVPRALFMRVLVGVGVLLCAVAVAVRSRVRRTAGPFGVEVLLFAYVAWAVLAGLAGWAWERSLFGSLARMEGVVLYLYGAAFLVAIRATFTERWYGWLIASSLVGAVGASLYGLAVILVPGVEKVAGGFAGMIGTLGNAGPMGAVGVLGVWAGAAVAERAESRPRRAAAGLGIVISGVGAVLSGSRAALLGLGAGIFVATGVWVTCAERKRRWLSRAAAGVGVAALAGIAAFGVATVGDVSVLGAASEGVERVAGAAGGLRERLALWKVGLRAVAEHPVLGVGPENFLVAFDRYVEPGFLEMEIRNTFFDRAHSAYVGHAVGGGLVGLLLYLAVWLVPCAGAVRAARQGKAGAARVALLVGGVISYLGYLGLWFEDPGSFVPALALLACVDRAAANPGDEASSDSGRGRKEVGTGGRWLTVGLAAIFAAGTLYHAVGVWRSARGLAVATRIPSMVERSRVLREAVERAPPGVGEADERLLLFAARMSRHRDRIRRVPGARTAAERAYRAAGNVYEERTAWDPRNARFRFYGAGYMLSAWRHFEERGYLERAIETTRAAVEHAPLRFRYRHQLARLLLLVERRSEAARLLEEGLERYDGHAETHALMARTRLEMGQVRPAYRSAERALELNAGALEPSLADRLIQRLEERGASTAANRIRRLRR